jgi:hypothetical protein
VLPEGSRLEMRAGQPGAGRAAYSGGDGCARGQSRARDPPACGHGSSARRSSHRQPEGDSRARAAGARAGQSQRHRRDGGNASGRSPFALSLPRPEHGAQRGRAGRARGRAEVGRMVRRGELRRRLAVRRLRSNGRGAEGDRLHGSVRRRSRNRQRRPRGLSAGRGRTPRHARELDNEGHSPSQQRRELHRRRRPSAQNRRSRSRARRPSPRERRAARDLQGAGHEPWSGRGARCRSALRRLHQSHSHSD